MTRRAGILVAGVLVLAIAVVAVAGTVMAQKGRFSDIIVQAPDDSEVVAVVQGKDIVRGDIRKLAEFLRSVDPGLTEDSSVEAIIVGVVDGFIIQAEVERRGLVATEEEARAFMEPHKEACLGVNGQECRDHIGELGLKTDEYWSGALADYRKDFGEMKLFQVVFREEAPAEADSDQLAAFEETYRSRLRSGAVITWNDVDLERLYEQALESE